MISGWQHKGSFVIKFRLGTNPDAGRFYGGIEHVASGRLARFDSLLEMLEFLQCVLKEVRCEFLQDETLADEITPDSSEMRR
jgi:hypothetical protein